MGGIFDRKMWTDGAPLESYLADPDVPAVATRHICYGGGKSGGGGGGGTTTQTSTVQIPQEVLNNYNTAWNAAYNAAQQPFTPYPGEMVAPVNPVQNTGIGLQLGQIGQAQPYFDAAGNALLGGAGAALPYYDQAGNLIANAANANSDYISAATAALYGGQQAANPYTAAANANLSMGQQQGQTMAQSALEVLYGGASAANPINASALGNVYGGQAQSQGYLNNAGQIAGQLANGVQGNSFANLGQAGVNLDFSGIGQASQGSVIPAGLGGGSSGASMDLGALAQLMQPNVNLSGLAQGTQVNVPQIGGTVSGIDADAINASLNNLQLQAPTVQFPNLGGGSSAPSIGPGALPQVASGAGGGGSPAAISIPAGIPAPSSTLAGFNPQTFLSAHGISGPDGSAPNSNRAQVEASLQQGIDAAATPQAQAQAQIAGALSAASPYNQSASQLLNAGLASASPYNQAAQQGISGALADAQPYQQQATQLAQGVAQAINPEAFSQEALQQYMSPYTQSVVEATMRQLQQQQGMEQQQLIGSLIQRGAFGGDRGNIDRAVLANQHDMATGSILANLYNQNYAQALGAFQQQQGVELGAAQANRAAQAQAAGLLGSLGQQGYAQQMGAASAQAALGQQIYGQQTGTGQALGQLGQNIFGQQLSAGQANAAMGAQLFGQGATTAQTQSALQQADFGQWAQRQQLQQQAQVAQGELGLGAYGLQQQGELGRGQLALGHAQVQGQQAIAAAQVAQAAQNAQIQMASIQQQGQLAMAQMGLQQAQLQQQGQIAAGQLGLSYAELAQQGQIAAGQLGIQAGQLSQAGQIALGELSLGQASLQQQGILGLGQLGLQQAGLAQQGQIAAGQLGLGQMGLAQQGQIAQGQLGLQQAGLQQQGQIAGAQLGLQQQQNLFGQGLSLAGLNAALGQQAYSQGLSTGQFETGLAGQLFGQGATTAGQVAGLGQQLYGQGANTAQLQAGLGQQVFGQGATTAGTLGTLGAQAGSQGLSSAQLMAGLGQNMYGMGSNTAQQLAGMGTTQQGNQLALAQAILGGGTLQQQTQQAADQAYYNQFLQQQGYPFQIAQFLSNIATSQGALSGSTTTATTTQPGSLFSDERLKQDKEIVGRTFDGQPVYRFAYKDDPGTTHLGLMAQDVEKAHPGAVGESDGYKTVNYDEATRGAAERGHFMFGGVPALNPANFSSPQAMAFAQRINQGGAGKGGTPGGGAGKGGTPGGGVPASPGLQMGGHGVALPPEFGGSPPGRATNPFGAAMLGLAQHGALPSQLAATRAGTSNPTGLLSPEKIQELIAGGAKDTKPPAPPAPAPKEEKPKEETPTPAASPSLFGGDDPSMDAWRRSMTNILPGGWNGGGAARGGAIDPSSAGTGFAYGGAGGEDYLQQLLAQILAKGPPQYGGAGIYGKPLGGSGPYGVPAGATGPKSLTPARLPDIPRPGPSALESGMSTISHAVQAGKSLGEAGKWVKEGLLGTAEKKDAKGNVVAPASEGWIGKGGKLDDKFNPFASSAPAAPALPVVETPPELPWDYLDYNPLARGGRAGFARGGLPYGQTEDEYLPEEVTKDPDISDLLAAQKSMAAPLPAIRNEGGGGGGGAGAGKQIGSALGSIAGSFLPFPGGTAVGSVLGGLFGGLFKEGGRVGYDEGGLVGMPDENDPVARLLDQLRATRPDIPALPPGPRDVPLELARDHLPGLERYERALEPKTPAEPFPESGTRGPREGALPPQQSVTVPAMPPLESRTVRGAPAPQPSASQKDGDIFERMLSIESGNRQHDDKGNVITSPKGATGIAQVMPATGPEAARLAGVEWDENRFRNDADYNRSLGQAYYNKQRQDFADPFVAAAAYNAGPGAVRAAQARAQKEGGNYLDYLPQETRNYVTRLQGGREDGVPRQIGPLAQTGAKPSVPQQQYMQPVDVPMPPTAGAAPAPADQPKKDDPNWFDRNERAIMSVLTGLGGAAAMGMNPRANLAGVLLAGLGAGAAQYAQMGRSGREMDIQERGLDIQQQAKQLEAAKYLKDTVIPRVDPVTGQTYYVNKATGQRMTEAQVGDLFKGVLGGKGFNLAPPPAQGGSAPTGGATSTQATGTPKPPQGIVEQQQSPEYLYGEAKKYMTASGKAYEQGDIEGANRFQKLAEEYTKRAEAITGVVEKGKSEATAPVELQKRTAEENMKTQMKARDEARVEAQNAANTVQQAQAALNLMFDPKTGRPTISGGPIGEKLTTLSAFLKQMGYSDEFVKGLTGTDPANAQALEKLRTTIGTEIARQELAGAPIRVTEFQRFLETTPSAALIPEAFKWIVNNSILPKAQAQMKAYEAIAGLDPSKDDVQKRLYEYGRDNPWYRPPAGAVTAAPSQPKETAPTTQSYTPDQIRKAQEELRRRREGKP